MRRTMKLNPRAVVVFFPMHKPVDEYKDESDTNHHGRVICRCPWRQIHAALLRDRGERTLTHSTWRDWSERWDAEDDCK